MKQGDSEAPILFVFAMQLATVEIEKEFKKEGTAIPYFSYNISKNAMLYHHKPLLQRDTIINLIIILLCIDNSTLLFKSREDMIKGTTIYISIIAKFGLTVHTSLGNKKSKMEAIFIPST